MAHTRLVFRGPLALSSAMLISLLMSASATVDVCHNYYYNFSNEPTQCCVATGACETSSCVSNNLGTNDKNCNRNSCDGVQCVPVPGCDPNSTLKCLGNTACDNNAPSCAGISANTVRSRAVNSSQQRICHDQPASNTSAGSAATNALQGHKPTAGCA
ncbi:hypothetical protein V8C86DRAFT_2949744, partial [Haematococcus lacustris]